MEATRMELNKRQRQAQQRIVDAIAEIDFIAPGSVTRRNPRCGKTNCRCHDDPPRLHGPYISWTRKVNNKTVTRLLTEEQLADYQPWFDNARKLKTLISQLEEITLDVIDNDERWGRK
jgi:hypothetical protein